MKYLGKILLSIREIFFMMIIHYLFLFICVLIIGFDKSIIWGSIILSIIEIIYILYKTKGSIFRYKKDSCLLPYIMIGIGITCIYNMIIFKLGLGFEVNTNVNVVTEMTNLIDASRSYDANVTAFNSSKSMALKGLEIGKA